MKIHTRLGVLLATVATTLGLAATTASASSLTPGDFDFGNQTVGKSSAAHPFVLSLTSNCIDLGLGGTVCIPQLAGPAISLTGPFSQTSDCPFLLSSPATCTSSVVFKPTQPGPATGTMTTGTGAATLRGNGVAAPKSADSGNGGGNGTNASKPKKKKKCHKHKHKGGKHRALMRKCGKHHK